MKLASAISERSDLTRRINEMETRLQNNAKVQEGDEPAEDPQELLRELDRMMARQEELIRRINLTNSAPLENGECLTALLAHRDALEKRISIMRAFLNSASEKAQRYGQQEIRLLSTVDVRKLQKELDKLSSEARETNERIQCLNWMIDLI